MLKCWSHSAGLNILRHETHRRRFQGLKNRRRFFEMLAASPLLGSFAAVAWQKEEAGSGVTSPRDAINVMDFEEAAHKVLAPAHWGYLVTGVDDDATLKANHEAYMTHRTSSEAVG